MPASAYSAARRRRRKDRRVQNEPSDPYPLHEKNDRRRTKKLPDDNDFFRFAVYALEREDADVLRTFLKFRNLDITRDIVKARRKIAAQGAERFANGFLENFYRNSARSIPLNESPATPQDIIAITDNIFQEACSSFQGLIGVRGDGRSDQATLLTPRTARLTKARKGADISGVTKLVQLTDDMDALLEHFKIHLHHILQAEASSKYLWRWL